MTLDQTQDWILPDGAQPTSRWRFGAVEIDEQHARVVVAGQTVALDRSSYEVLRRLAAGAGQVVSKEDLLQAGWRDRVVTENSLVKAIGRLRQIIGDSDGDVLRVVHGYGYRLAASIERDIVAAAGMDAAPVVAVSEPTPPSITRKPGRRRLLLLAGTLLLVVAVAAISLLRSRAPEEVVAPAASIAVLPFADLSAEHDQRHFADGLADELLDALIRVPRLYVASRTASFAYRSTDSDLPAMGRALHAATILHGSVRRSGGRIRVTAQLSKTADGYEIWSQTYDRPVTELFEMQDDIVRAIVGALRIELMPDQQRDVIRHRTSSAAAYEEFLLAQEVFRDDETANRRSIAHFEHAVELDPKFVDAWIGLANVLGHSGMYADRAEEALAGKRRALAILDHAIALAPDRADAWRMRGTMRYAHWWNWAGADADFAHAAELGPRDDPSLLVEQARLRAASGSLVEALALDQRATQVNPQSANAWTVMGYHLIGLGQLDRARDVLAQASRVEPLDEHARYYLGLIELLQGNSGESLPHFEDSAHVLRLTGLALAHHTLGDAPASERELQLLISRYGQILPYQAAEVYAWRGEADQAFAWLDRAFELHDASFMYLEFDPLLHGIRADSRFAALLVRVGLPAQRPAN